MSPSKKKIVHSRDDYRCYICGKQTSVNLPPNHPDRSTVDHVKPRGRGGTNKMDNLRCCCYSCNNEKGSKKLNRVLPNYKQIEVPNMHEKSIDEDLNNANDRARQLMALYEPMNLTSRVKPQFKSEISNVMYHACAGSDHDIHLSL